MYHIKNDKRSIHSSKILYDSLAKLMREKDFNAIKVKDLVETAHVGRVTFYRHFDKIKDILQMKCDQVFEDLERYLKDYRQKYVNESQLTLLKPILRFFYLESELIELLILANLTGMLRKSFQKISEQYKPKLSSFFGLEKDYLDYLVTMRIGGITSVLLQWIATGKKQAPDELADKLGEASNDKVPISLYFP